MSLIGTRREVSVGIPFSAVLETTLARGVSFKEYFAGCALRQLRTEGRIDLNLEDITLLRIALVGQNICVVYQLTPRTEE